MVGFVSKEICKSGRNKVFHERLEWCWRLENYCGANSKLDILSAKVQIPSQKRFAKLFSNLIIKILFNSDFRPWSKQSMVKASEPLLLTFRNRANLLRLFQIFHKDSLLIFEKGQINIEGNYFKLLGRIIFKLEEFWWNNYFEFAEPQHYYLLGPSCCKKQQKKSRARNWFGE